MKIRPTDVGFFSMATGQAIVARGHPPAIVNHFARRIGYFARLERRLFLHEQNFLRRIFDARVFKRMPNSSSVANGGHPNGLAVFHIVAGETITVIIRPRERAWRTRVAGIVSISVVLIAGTSEGIAAGKAGTQ